MKALIAYTTKNGTTYKCVQMLRERICGFCDVTVVNLLNETPDIANYDIVVAGGSIRIGCLNKKLKSFLNSNTARLNNIPCAVFLCCGFSDNFEDYIETQLPRGLVPSLGISNFGGELKPENLHGFDKFIVKRVRESIKYEDIDNVAREERPLPEIVPENISLLAEKIRGLLNR